MGARFVKRQESGAHGFALAEPLVEVRPDLHFGKGLAAYIDERERRPVSARMVGQESRVHLGHAPHQPHLPADHVAIGDGEAQHAVGDRGRVKPRR